MEHSILEYKGQLTSEIRIQLLDLLKCMALVELAPKSSMKKLIGVALELLDNAQRYNTSDKIDFLWHFEEPMVVITIRNKADQIHAHRLIEAVDMIASMTPDQIVNAFHEQLTNNEFGEEGGAGLGMLQIARKVGGAISAEITPAASNEFICTSTVRTMFHQIPKRA